MDSLGQTLDFDTFLVDGPRKRDSSGRPSTPESPVKSHILVQGTSFPAFLTPNLIFLVPGHRPLPWLPNWHHARQVMHPSATIQSRLITLNRFQNIVWNNSFAVGTKLAVTTFCISMFCQKSNATNEIRALWRLQDLDHFID